MSKHIDELRLVIGAMVILAIATSIMVIIPWILVEPVHNQATLGTLQPYTDQQLRGRQVYINNGCMYCHTQQPRDPSQAPDFARGWGRPSVAADYVYDNPHLLGTMRTGPDLMNIGVRQPSADWHLGHLYQPRAYLPNSNMPAYPYLFERKPADQVREGERIINLPPGLVPEGEVVVATQEAEDLVVYLLGMDRTYPAVPSLPIPRQRSIEE